MPLILRSAEEVYRHYLDEFGDDGDGDPNAVGLFAYALVERDKFEWIMHHRTHIDGAGPSGVEVERWYAEKPESYFSEKSGDAAWWYKAFARSLLEDDIRAEKEAAIRTSVVETVERIKSETVTAVTQLTGFKAFGINVLAGVVAGVVVSAAALFFYALHEAHNPDLVDQLKSIVDSHNAGSAPAPH